jgi:type VI secretion system secreted protein Hcp
MAGTMCLCLGKDPKKPDVPGESKVGQGAPQGSVDHGGHIDCLSWRWGMQQTGSALTGSGGSTGTCDVSDFTITKYVDSSSPLLYKFCFHATPLQQSTFSCIKVGKGGKLFDYIKITLGGTDAKEDTCMISAVSSGVEEIVDGKPTGRFIESVSIHFNKALYEYWPQKADQDPDASKSSDPMRLAVKA